MAQTSTSELAAFHRFVGQHLADDDTDLSPEEVLDRWRAENPTAEELAQSVAAVKRALEQAERGEGTRWEEFDRRFREKHGISLER